ncbi:MAG: cbb3-type cytochrome oxidase assembly protein CcoS [Thermomonas sp.]|uniref:cbb3-type cytochrome oxidase assembly protein CcoS n=1 Tax=Thermomonas sp. TaxID=1971895 RepID=UPI001D246326|nr:cbb3-type cytochrome oxidase assembly protein CcoS [Thermomonas sp.]MBZ0088412.1 cbb3-type cytochrome oxidase assembly protein CcoS [Thermomonas sp.]MCO5054450.1 cbb3-type cytochrome oxidase assembly protein CcoS [Thermomonas sp.]
MNILLFLIPISLVLIGVAAWVFVWAVRHGQFEDLDTPALDVLRDDARPVQDKDKPSAPAAGPGQHHAD